MKKIRLTTSQALVKFLQAQYVQVDGKEWPFVEGIFTIFGHGNVLGIGQALQENQGDLKVFQGKNEQGMAQSAIAFSKQLLRKKIFAVTTSVGPGAANLVTAAGTALANNIPVLLLPGDTFSSRQPDPVLQQIEHEHNLTISTNDSLKAVSRYWDRITRPEQLMSSLLHAFEVMTNPSTAGPATICIPQDVAGESFEYEQAFFDKRVHYIDRKNPTMREKNEVVELIKKSKKPLIIVGGGAKYSEAQEIIETFSHDFKIALVETQAGKSTVPSDFKYNLGGVGVTGNSAANKAAKEADLIIGIGTRFTDFTTSSKTAFDFEHAKFISINVNRMQAYKLNAFQVVADAKLMLEEIHLLLKGYESDFAVEILDYKKEWSEEVTRLRTIEYNKDTFVPEIENHYSQEKMDSFSTALHTELIQTPTLIKFNEFVASDSIIVASAGSIPGDLQRLWISNTFNTYHVEYGYSCMGYEIAGAYGAKIAAPNQEVYALLGDGSFLMLHSELISAIQYDQKINVILLDNAGYGCISNLQMEQGSDEYFCDFKKADGSLLTVDYAKVAEGYGAKVYKVNTLTQLERALEDAKKQSNSTLIDIKVLPKTMTKGYDSWWNVGVAEHSNKVTVQQADVLRKERLKNAKQY